LASDEDSDETPVTTSASVSTVSAPSGAKPQSQKKKRGPKPKSSEEPSSIPPVATKIHLITIGRRKPIVDSTTMDLNEMDFNEVVEFLESGLSSPPFKMKEHDLAGAEITIVWNWLSYSKYEGAKKFPSNAFSRPDHYEALKFELLGTVKKEPALHGHILRFEITVQKDTSIEEESDHEGRAVSFDEAQV
jgi:hypothetical protein